MKRDLGPGAVELPVWYERKWSDRCETCERKGIERSGGLWCPWCRHWLNDPRGWRLFV